VVEVLPSFAVADPVITPQLTIHNLVCSCTGVPQRDFELFFRSHQLSAENVIESLQHYELFTAVGETFQYSNQMVAVGGYAAAAAAGGRYGHLYGHYVAEMQQRVFTPIGMAQTTFALPDVTASANYAHPHSVNLELEPVVLPLAVEQVVMPVAPAGAAWSNVVDLARYLLTQLNNGVAPNGQEVVSGVELAKTWRPQVAVSANTSYGLGWFIDQYKGLYMLHHGGNTAGFTSDLAFLPQADLGISVLSNAQGANFFTEAVRFRLLELLFQQEHRYDAHATYLYEAICHWLIDPETKLGQADFTQVAPFLGWYTNPALGVVEIRWQDDTLVLRSAAAVADLRPRLNGAGQVEKYVVFNPPMAGLPLQFTRDQLGDPVVVLGVGVTQYEFERVGGLAAMDQPPP
jgi:CubicO group peptidase (beta-lactamase class C family)